MSGWIFLVAGLVIAAGELMIGLRFSRMSGEQLQREADGSVRSPDRINRLGRSMMILGPVFLLVFAALAFGVIPAGDIEPIAFN